PRGHLHVIDQIVDLARQATRHANVQADRIRLAVVAVPGAPQPGSGRIALVPNIAGFETIDIAHELESRLSVDVVLENDVNLAVYGEHWLGGGRNVDDLAYIALGTGLGAGIMIGGNLIRGARGAAGELGYLPFGSDPFNAESRRVGALERRIGTVGIEGRYRELTGNEAGVPEIFDLAHAGDSAATEVLDDTARVLARAVAAICAIVDPRRVLLGGGIGSRHELVARVREILPDCMAQPPEIDAGELGANATIVGATAKGLGLLHNSLFGAPIVDSGPSLPPADHLVAQVAG
ncbi:MAG: ROK family protein, partial [Pseudomonadota bacterium]